MDEKFVKSDVLTKKMARVGCTRAKKATTFYSGSLCVTLLHRPQVQHQGQRTRPP